MPPELIINEDSPPDIMELSEVAGVSYSDLQDSVRGALREKYNRALNWVWVAELYDDKVVFEVTPRNRMGDESGRATYFSAPYSFTTETMKADIGEPTEVVRKITFVPVNNNNVAGESDTETDLSDELTELVESAAGAAKREVKIIAPGWGASGYYSPDVLKRDGPLAFAAGTHMYLDHPTESESRERPERSVRDLAAVTVSTPEYREDGAAGPGLYATATILPTYAEVIDHLAPHIGVSIRARGSFVAGEAEGRKGNIVSKIIRGESVDFVTKPGAGGKVGAIMESLRQKTPPAVVSTASEGNDANAALQAADIHLHQEAGNMELSEAQERITTLEGEVSEAKTKTTEETDRADRAEGALAIIEARTYAKDSLANVSLPDAAKERIAKKLSANPPVKDGKLDTEALGQAIEAEAKVEADYIESITKTGTVTDQGTQSGAGADETKVREGLSDDLGSVFGLSDEAAKAAAAR